jgi:hypothetical protein
MSGFHDGVSKVWIVRIGPGQALDVDGFPGDVEAIDRLIRHAVVRDSGEAMKARIRAAVDDALEHMDDDGEGPASEGE